MTGTVVRFLSPGACNSVFPLEKLSALLLLLVVSLIFLVPCRRAPMRKETASAHSSRRSAHENPVVRTYDVFLTCGLGCTSFGTKMFLLVPVVSADPRARILLWSGRRTKHSTHSTHVHLSHGRHRCKTHCLGRSGKGSPQLSHWPLLGSPTSDSAT
jgi:hypothetical protein